MIRYEWKPMSEADNNTVAAEVPFAESSVAVVVPLFPKLPGIRESLASLGAQTRPPNLVVLLDDGTNREADTLPEAIPGLHVELVQVEAGSLPAAINAVMEYLANFEFVTFLQAGDAYAPERIERCLAAFVPLGDRRPPSLVVTALQAVDSRGQPLAPDDPRAQHLRRLWAPGTAGAGLAEWLGTGYFPGPASNIFARRAALAAHPLPEHLAAFDQVAVLTAALQGLMSVVPEPLLLHYPPGAAREPTARMMNEALQVQLAVLLALRDKLGFSPETRRLAAAYHRAAWNSRSGVREDLFQQLVLRLAAAAAPESAQAVLSEILRSHESRSAPAHWAALLEGRDPLDLAGYADALRRTREELAEARAENDRLRQVAGAAQNSGWVRFGAWLGDRASRRMMEMEEEAVEGVAGPVETPVPDGTAPDEKPGAKTPEGEP